MLKIEYLNNERFESQIKTVTSSIDPSPRYQVHWTGMVMPYLAPVPVLSISLQLNDVNGFQSKQTKPGLNGRVFFHLEKMKPVP